MNIVQRGAHRAPLGFGQVRTVRPKRFDDYLFNALAVFRFQFAAAAAINVGVAVRLHKHGEQILVELSKIVGTNNCATVVGAYDLGKLEDLLAAMEAVSTHDCDCIKR